VDSELLHPFHAGAPFLVVILPCQVQKSNYELRLFLIAKNTVARFRRREGALVWKESDVGRRSLMDEAHGGMQSGGPQKAVPERTPPEMAEVQNASAAETPKTPQVVVAVSWPTDAFTHVCTYVHAHLSRHMHGRS